MNHDGGIAPRRVLARIILTVLPILAVPSFALALSDEELFREFGFNLTNPGGRSVGMAGASAAVVNDATSALANPAGLHFVRVPEIFMELRYVDPDETRYGSQLGSLEVDLVTGDRDLPFLGLTSVSESDDSTDLGFFSAAWPVQVGERRLTLAISSQQVLDEEKRLGAGGDMTGARFSFESFPNTVNMGMIEAYSVNTSVSGGSETDVVYLNVSGSFNIHEDFSIGATLTRATLDLKALTTTRVDDPLQLFLDPSHPRRPTSPSEDIYQTVIDDDDSDLVWSVGLHLHPDSLFAGGLSPWSFGAVYRKGAAFTVREFSFLNGLQDQEFDNNVIVPDRYGFGIGYRPSSSWLISFELERIEYEDMLDGYRTGVNYLTSGRVAGEAFMIDPNRPVEFIVDDGTVPRIGVEYNRDMGGSPWGRTVSVWGGYFRLPDGRIRMSRFNSTDDKVNATYLDAFREGDDTDHFTAGVGFTVGRNTFQVAGQTSDLGTQVVGSYVFRWLEPPRVRGTLEITDSP